MTSHKQTFGMAVTLLVAFRQTKVKIKWRIPPESTRTNPHSLSSPFRFLGNLSYTSMIMPPSQNDEGRSESSRPDAHTLGGS